MKRAILLVSLLVVSCAIVFVINQTAQVVALASTVNPTLGKVVLAVLLGLYATAVLVPLVILVRLEKPLRPPLDVASPEYEEYLRRLGQRLASNRHLRTGSPIHGRESIESALAELDSKANEVTRQAATTLFVSTAVSQNGRLDALMVLAEQTRLIWRIAHIYNHRPSVREFALLYGNVAATLFAASALEDLDIDEQVEPVVKASIGGAVAGLVPGVAAVASVVMASIMDGTANAYLTLRVGIIAQSYCRAVTVVDRRATRRSASLAAAGMLGSIVTGSAVTVARAMLAACKRAGMSTVESAVSGIRGASARLNPFKPGAEKTVES